MTPLKFKKVQKELDELPPLYLSNYKEEYSFGNWDIQDFILQFLVSLCSDNTTINSKTGLIECGASKRRSIGDIYRLCKYYYDSVTLLEVQYWLAVLTKAKKIGYFYCNSTKKRVYMSKEFYKTHSVNPVQYASPDEYNFSIRDLEELSQLQVVDVLN